ncbi:calcium-binding protein [Sphingomonas sp. HITSZ_GF]|uniref:beta strand repeat-containing protein n=1 Tax=Sphingomonas sp. HITSZ_GF TaxID=3037247 RepID=UPI00240D930B|nr:calcium-binding protein [Sphingomonas sp. HITSZ_GF]MDG2535385.1 calcium-binding protein [Sphingomonas sp. HITSZ_GF]
MPIPPIDAPTGEPNVTSTATIDQDTSIASGQIRYSTGLSRMLASGDGWNGIYPDLNNAGTLWASNAAGVQLLYGMNFGTVTNSGTMVARSADGEAYAITVTSHFEGMTNSGSIYAIGNLNALTIQDWAGFGSADIVNSGILAAQASLHSTAIARFNGGRVVNAAGGQILSQSQDAVGIYLGRGHSNPPGWADHPDIENAGLIEAISTGSGASAAIYVTHLDSELMEIVNSGTIRGDFAIYADGSVVTSTIHPDEQVTNLAGGVIDGAIWLDLGEDLITNHGTIDGWIDMGEDNDRIDNRDGVITGVSNLGWGADTYWGGAQTDAVTGDRGDDTILGGGGNDLLLGGWGNDTLQGDAGNDGLYGEGGNDRIITQGGDLVVAGAGDDRIELGDYSFASVSGGIGHDVLVLPAGDLRIVELSQVAASSRVSGIDEIELGSGQWLAIRPGDLAALTDAATLVVSGGGAGTIDLAGSWTLGTDVIRDGVRYLTYASGAETLLVDARFLVRFDATGLYRGLDGVAGGDSAPVAGQIAGAVLTPDHVTANAYYLTSTLTIERGESWESNGGVTVLTGDDAFVSLYNYGSVMSSGGDNGAIAISATLNQLFNYGDISASAFTGTANLASNIAALNTYGISNSSTSLQGNVIAISSISGSWQFRNEGSVLASSVQTIAIGYQNWSMHEAINIGAIRASSSAFMAVGLYAHNGGLLINSGTIEATAALAAYGVAASTHVLNLDNSGTIRATTTGAGRAESIGVFLYWEDFVSTIHNSGLISADVAITFNTNVNRGQLWLDNSGRIEGRIDLLSNSGEDRIFNTGTLTGNVSMGTGRDIFYAPNGIQTGVINGGDGGDYLAGSSSAAERLEGGAGDDILVGGGGDTLTGGAGRDIFAFTRGTGTDTITDFVSGTDRIDLTALHPTAVSISGSTVTVTSGAGVLTIQASGVTMADILTTRTDTFTGTDGDDTLYASADGSTLIGGAGYDLLIGGAGNDWLDGGTGGTGGLTESGDILMGGAGDDVYVVSNGWTQVIEFANGGFDTVMGANGVAVVMADNIEQSVGGSATGNALDNIMIGSDRNDILDGGAGIDRMQGGLGDDSYYVDRQEDLVFEQAGQGTDTINSSVSFYLYENVENLTLVTGTTAQFGVGNDLANIITGNEQDNLLLGYDGDDTIYGGQGNDWVYGMGGNDTLWGSDGTDYLIGGDGNDVLQGALIDGLTHEGRGGQDFLYGGAGDDTYYVDDAADLTFEDAGGGNDTVYANASRGTIYLYANVENLVLQGSTLYGVGNELDNRITGSDTTNWLLGGAGNDRIDGGKGNDVLYGQDGADTFVFGASSGIDTIGDFTVGTDKIDLSAYGFASFAAVQAAMTDQGGGIMNIALGGGNYVILIGVAKAQLSAGDFILSAQAEPEKADVMAPEASVKGAPVMAVDGGGKGVAAEVIALPDTDAVWHSEPVTGGKLAGLFANDQQGLDLFDPGVTHHSPFESNPFHFA